MRDREGARGFPVRDPGKLKGAPGSGLVKGVSPPVVYDGEKVRKKINKQQTGTKMSLFICP